jgi:uncharacterized membrane protein YfcA
VPAPADLATACAVVAISAALQGFLGFGFGIAAMSLLTLGDDLLHAAALVNVTGLFVTGTLLWSLRKSALWRRALPMLPGLFAGVALGVLALGHVERASMVRILGASVVAIAAWNLAAPHLRSPRSLPLDVGVSVLSGLLSGAFNTGGPPLVAHLYAQRDDPEATKATIQALFLAAGAARLPLSTSQGLVAPDVWREAALAAPFAVAGLALGLALARRMSPERFRRAAWAGLGALGGVLLVTG